MTLRTGHREYPHNLAKLGLLPPSPAPPGSGFPQLHRPAATGSAAKVSHLHSNLSASRRTHTLGHAFITAALDAGVPLHDVLIAVRHADLRTTVRYDRARQNPDRHPNYILAANMASGTWPKLASPTAQCRERPCIADDSMYSSLAPDEVSTPVVSSTPCGK